MSTVDVSKLTAEERAALKAQLDESERAEKDRIKNERKAYKAMVDNAVMSCFPMLKTLSEQMSEAKSYTFDTFKTLVKMKADLYESANEEQFSHTFTNLDGSVSITIGKNINDGWDDTVNTGIDKVQEFIKKMAKDENSKNLVNTVLRLLSKDSKGNLKASRVLQLKKLADDVGDKELQDAIQIIQDAYRPTTSQDFIRCTMKGNNGEKLILPLSISEVPFVAVEEAASN
jgi:Protein of unknown function (DUF3164)